jgi:4-carboxymuconolactone decarboxylase
VSAVPPLHAWRGLLVVGQGVTRQQRFLPDELSDDRRALYDAIASGPRSQGPQLFPLTDADGALRGPFNGFLLSPVLGDALQRLGAAVRYGTALSDRVREMAILVVAARWDSAFERESHEAVGRAVGLTEEEVQALRAGRVPLLADPQEAAALTLVRALVTGDVDDETWARCVPPLTQEEVFELSTLVGYYGTLALQLRVFRIS